MRKISHLHLPAFITVSFLFLFGTSHAQNVGIGTTTPAYTLDVTGNLAITGNFANTATSVNSIGLYGGCNNTANYGYGVAGFGGYVGVHGDATLTGTGNRVGVNGYGENGAGSNYGVFGLASGGTTAYGIYGNAFGATTNYAGYFVSGNVYVQNKVGIGTLSPASSLSIESNNTSETAIDINNTSSGGIPYRIQSVGSGNAGRIGNFEIWRSDFGINMLTIQPGGNVGIGTTAPAYTLDVSGSLAITGNFVNTSSLNNTGVYGSCNNSANFGFGVHGDGGFIGVYGTASLAGSGDRIGVEGYGSGGTGSNYGVYAYAIGTAGTGASGIYATASGATTNYAGYFSGAIYATTANASVKAFRIDHPLDPLHKYLFHSSVESPDMKNIYDGIVITGANSEATVLLPDYFMSLNKDFRYQLTIVDESQFAQARVSKEISNNSFTIKTDKPNVKVSWQVTGIRQDPAANYYRIVPEVNKKEGEDGKYQVPEAYGKPANMGIGYMEKRKSEK